MDPSRLAMRSLNPGGCIDEAGLAEGAGLGGSARPGKTGEAGSVSCRIQGAGSWGGVRLRKGKEVHVSALQQSTCTVRFHLGMGGRGGAPRVALFVLLG